jgi:hypothetical protein
VPNPLATGSTGAFFISQNDKSNIIAEEIKSASTKAAITTIPKLLHVFNITTSSDEKQDVANYVFNLDPATTIPATKGEIWVRFPDYDFAWELPGFGKTYTCAATKLVYNVSTPWFEPEACTNSYENTVIASGSNTAYLTSGKEMLNFMISKMKSPSLYTNTKNIEIATYDNTTKAFIDRSYGTASADDILIFAQDKFETFVGDGDDTIEIGTGVILTYELRTSSPLIPFKVPVTFVSSI